VGLVNVPRIRSAFRLIINIWIGLMVSVLGTVAVLLLVSVLIKTFGFQLGMSTLAIGAALAAPIVLPISIWSVKGNTARAIAALSLYLVYAAAMLSADFIHPLLSQARLDLPIYVLGPVGR
jgi:hypothetical protein